jgi:hypothetical protein
MTMLQTRLSLLLKSKLNLQDPMKKQLPSPSKNIIKVL